MLEYEKIISTLLQEESRSVTWLARRAGKSYQTVYSHLSGRTAMRAKDLELYLGVLGYHLEVEKDVDLSEKRPFSTGD